MGFSGGKFNALLSEVQRSLSDGMEGKLYVYKFLADIAVGELCRSQLVLRGRLRLYVRIYIMYVRVRIRLYTYVRMYTCI